MAGFILLDKKNDEPHKVEITVNNKQYSNLSPVVPWKVQLLSALIFAIVVFIHTGVFIDHSVGLLLNNFIANSLVILLLWQGAFFVSKTVARKYLWDTQVYQYLGLSFLLGYITAFAIVSFIELAFDTLAPNDPFPRLSQLVFNVHISFLILCIMLAVINLIIYFHQYRLKQIKETESRYERYYEQLLNNADDVILVMDLMGVVKFSSASVQSLTGYSTEEVKSMNAFLWIHPEDRQRVQNELAVIGEETDSFENALSNRNQAGSMETCRGKSGQRKK